jgi:2,5-diketo-D-gluconate reductase A
MTNNTNTAPTIILANGVEIPALGLGTSPMNDSETERATIAAIEAGYRLFDTAENYRNEGGVGRGIRASGIDRAEVFITTKFNAQWHGIHEVETAWSKSANLLQVDYIDLLLIHWPNPKQDRYVDAWKGMIKLLEAGKVRSIGVSNFKPAHIDRLIAERGVTPHLNQIQLNPNAVRSEERAYHAAHGIVTESWSPLGSGRGVGDLLKAPSITSAAKAHAKTPGQVVLRWHVQQGLLPVPKSSNPQRLAQNLSVFDFELSDAEMRAITALDRGGAGVMDSDKFGH